MILTEMCHRSSSALRTRFHRGNDILKVSHQPTTIYERKNPMKGSAFNGMTSQAARGSRRWFPFHLTRLLQYIYSFVFIRVHPSNERITPILAFRIHRVPSSAYIRFTSKKIHSFGEKENEMIE